MIGSKKDILECFISDFDGVFFTADIDYFLDEDLGREIQGHADFAYFFGTDSQLWKFHSSFLDFLSDLFCESVFDGLTLTMGYYLQPVLHYELPKEANVCDLLKSNNLSIWRLPIISCRAKQHSIHYPSIEKEIDTSKFKHHKNNWKVKYELFKNINCTSIDQKIDDIFWALHKFKDEDAFVAESFARSRTKEQIALDEITKVIGFAPLLEFTLLSDRTNV